MPTYLTEAKLGLDLLKIFPNNTFIHNRKVPNSGISHRPDFRCDELMLIVEFDGYLHYTSSAKILNEEFKNRTYIAMGYKIVRIPYFIQFNSDIIKQLFGIDFYYEQQYPHGFIDSKALLPADFCWLGIAKFVDNLEYFKSAKEQIIKSLRDNALDRRLVLPVILEKYLI